MSANMDNSLIPGLILTLEKYIIHLPDKNNALGVAQTASVCVTAAGRGELEFVSG
jgi:hypothetical protein